MFPSFFGFSDKPAGGAAPSYEDLTTYTEYDPSNRMSETSARVTLTNADRDEDFWLYYDFGVSYFNSLDIDFEIQLDTGSATNEQVGGALANTTHTIDGLGTTDIGILFSVAAGSPTMYLSRGNFLASDSYGGLSLGTTYYCTLSRAAASDTVQLLIYSDSGRTTLVDTLTVTGYGTGTRYRYLIPMTQYNSGSGGYTSNGWTQNWLIN